MLQHINCLSAGHYSNATHYPGVCVCVCAYMCVGYLCVYICTHVCVTLQSSLFHKVYLSFLNLILLLLGVT